MEIRRLHAAIDANIFYRLLRAVPESEVDNFVARAIVAALDEEEANL